MVALLANQALHLSEHRLVIQYAQTALRAARGRLSPALAADLHALAGKAYARMGDIAGCHEHLKLAEAAARQVDHQDEPVEVSYMTPGLVETQVAEALRRLGDLPAACAYAEESVRTAPATPPAWPGASPRRLALHRNDGSMMRRKVNSQRTLYRTSGCTCCRPMWNCPTGGTWTTG